ncbi:hypothetical protein PENTCL1PPCAC_26158, partial [Pristionchus entomophagus]
PLLLLPALALAKLHDSDVSGICSINWDEIEDQLALDNSVCCNEALHRDLYRSLSRLNQKHANQSQVIDEVTPLIPSDLDAHVVATEGVMAISAPGLGKSFCKQRVGAVHVLIQQSPISDPMGFSVPSDRSLVCDHPALTRRVGEIIAEWKLPEKMSGGQIVKVFAKELFSHFNTRIWLTLSEKRVAFRSNAHLSCEFPVGDRLYLTVFTFQTLPSSFDAIEEDESLLKAETVEIAPLPPKSDLPPTDFSISETSTQLITETDSPSTTVLPTTVLPIVLPPTTVPSSETSFQKVTLADEEPVLKVRSEGIFKRDIGRARLGGCGNDRLKQIMQKVLGPLLARLEKRLGDIAQRLQQVVQRVTGRSFEILMGKGDLVTASHQMSQNSHCRLRIGNHYTMVYETPIQYDIHNAEAEKVLANIDFGEKLGGSGFPGQRAFSRFDQIITHLGDRGFNTTRFGAIADRLHFIHEQRRGGFSPLPDGPPPFGGRDPFPPPPFDGPPRFPPIGPGRFFG